MPHAHFLQMFTNGHWGKWALGKNIHLGERGSSSGLKGYPKCPGTISPKCSQMGPGANGHLGKMDIWGKEYPKCRNVTEAISPQLFTNGHLGKMDIWRKKVPQVP